MSLAQLRREISEIQEKVGSREIVEAWIYIREESGKKFYRGFHGHKPQTILEIDGDTMQGNWRNLEEHGYHIQAMIYVNANLERIYKTGEGYVDPHATETD